MAKLAYDIILEPVITEKSMEMLTQGKYTFKVAKDSNKIEIAKAVEALFPGVKVAKVNTVNCRAVEWREVMICGFYRTALSRRSLPSA